jgi:hypothetical protein
MAKPEVNRAYLRALKYDYLGEVSTEVNFRLQAYFTREIEVAAKAKEFADLEASTRQLIGAELARFGVKMGNCQWLRIITFVLLIPIKLVLPTRIWVRLIYHSTIHALKLYREQERRWGAINPEFFRLLVEHEIKQHDWAQSYLQSRR